MNEHLDSKRVSDEAIYLEKDQMHKTKKIFVRIADYIEEKSAEDLPCILDVGCATGDLFVYLKTRINATELVGIDISDQLLKAAKERLPEINFFQEDIASENGLSISEMDYVIASGVLDYLDNPEQAISNLIGSVRSGGKLIIWDLFNPFPIDVIVKYRRFSKTPNPWESGWNNFSQAYITQILKNDDRVKGFYFERFSLGEKLYARTDDPLRTWTIDCDNNPYQMINGLGQLVHQYFLFVEVV